MEPNTNVMICKEPEHQIGVQASSPVAWSYDGTLLAYVSGAFSILIYKYDSTKQIFSPYMSLVRHTQPVIALMFHPTLPLLLSCGNEGIFIWNIETGSIQQIIDESTCQDAHESTVECFCWGYSGSILFTASKDATVKIWNVNKNFTYMETIQAHRSSILAIVFNEPYNMLITAGRDSTINLWDAISLSPSKIQSREDDKGTCCTLITSMDGHLGDITSLCINQSGTLLFSGARDNTIRAWDIKTHAIIREIRDSNNFQKGNHQGDVRSIFIINNDQNLVSFGADGEMKLFKLGDMKSDNSTNAGDMMVSLDVLLKGFVETEDIKEIINDELLSSITIEDSGVYAASFNPKLPFLALAGYSNIIRVLDVSQNLAQPILKQEYVGHHDAVTDIAIMDDKHIVSVSKDYSINIYNVSNNSRQFHFYFNSAVLAIGCFHDIIFVTGIDYIVKAYSINKNRFYQTMEQYYASTNTKVPSYEYELLHMIGHSGKISSIAVCPDLALVATGSEDFSLRLWDIPETIESVGMNRNVNNIPVVHASTILKDHNGCITSVAFSDLIGDTYFLTSVGNDYSIITYKLKENKQPTEYWTVPNAHNGVITCSTFGHNKTQNFFYTGGWDNKINIWSIQDKKLLLSLNAHTARITEIDISPDGKYLVSASADKSIIIWNVEDEKCSILAKYMCNEIPLTVDFFQDKIIAGYHSGVIRLWPLPDNNNSKAFTIETLNHSPIETAEEQEQNILLIQQKKEQEYSN